MTPEEITQLKDWSALINLEPTTEDHSLVVVVASGYDVACSCGGAWRIVELMHTTCPDCGTFYDASEVADASSHAY